MKFKTILKYKIYNASQAFIMHIAKSTFYNSIRYLEHQEIRDSANFIRKHLDGVALFDNKKGGYFQFVMSEVQKNSQSGLWLEFGVRSGVSAKFFAKYALQYASQNRLYGFDAFEGIRDNWSSISEPAGSFSLNGIVPPPITGCEFVIGWVEDTLPNFLSVHADEPIVFAHFDFDVYKPTKFALESIRERLRPGSIIMFDEFHGYPGWEFNEKKALDEVLSPNTYKFIAFSRKQAAIKIL